MRHWKIWLYLIFVSGILLFCLYSSLPASMLRARQTKPIAQAVTRAAPSATQADLVATETTEVTQTPAQEPEQTAAVASEQVDYCTECHTDKDELIDTAAPEEEVVKESEGAG